MAELGSATDNDRVPGTVFLIDVARNDHGSSHDDVVLIPKPSADPEDPLNWRPARKMTTVCKAYLYVFGTGIATSLQYSVWNDITRDTGISTANLVQGTGLMFLFFGWACLIWQPLALAYGRRGVYLITMLLTIPMMEWTAYSTSSREWVAHRVLIGIIASPIESLCEVTIFDLYFAHNRGTYMALYVVVLFGSNFLVPLVAGWFNDAYGWRWTMHLGSIVCPVCFVVIFFFMEETIYFRHDAFPQANASASDMEDKSAGSSEKVSSPMTAESTASGDPVSAMPEPSTPGSRSVCTRWSKYALFRLLPGRPSKAETLRMVYRPVIMIFRLPPVAWAGFLYGINLA
jgi:MFS family permease